MNPKTDFRKGGRFLNAGLVGLFTFVSAVAVFKGFSAFSWDAVYQPMIQGVLAFFAALGIGPASRRITNGQ